VYDEIRDLGAELVAISPQTTEKNAAVKKNNRLAFPVLSDPGHAYARQLALVHTLPDDLREVYTAFDIVLPAFNGDDTWELPLSTRIVTDTSSTIRAIDADVDYTRRPEPVASLEVLRTA